MEQPSYPALGARWLDNLFIFIKSSTRLSSTEVWLVVLDFERKIMVSADLYKNKLPGIPIFISLSSNAVGLDSNVEICTVAGSLILKFYG